MDQIHTSRFQCVIGIGLDNPSTTQSWCCASHLTSPPRIHGEPILCVELIDYCPASGTCRFTLLSNGLVLTRSPRFGTSGESTLGSTFNLPRELVLIFFQIQAHHHQKDCTCPRLCAYWYIIPYLSFSWTTRRNSAVPDMGKYIQSGVHPPFLPNFMFCSHIHSIGSRLTILQTWWTGMRVVNQMTMSTSFNNLENGRCHWKWSNVFPVLSSPTARRICRGYSRCSVRERYVQFYAWSILTSCDAYGQPAASYHHYEDVLASHIQTHAGMLLIFLTVPCWVLMQESENRQRQEGCLSDSRVLPLMYSIDLWAPQAGGFVDCLVLAAEVSAAWEAHEVSLHISLIMVLHLKHLWIACPSSCH